MIYDETLLSFIIVSALVALLFLLRLAAREWASGKVSTIMLNVEKKFSTWVTEKAITGKEKRIHAERIIITKLYPMVPAWIKLFITEEWLIDQIDKLYIEMLDYFDDGELNHSIN